MSSVKSSIREFDAMFLQIISEINLSIISLTENAVCEVIKASTGFLSVDAQNAIEQFHNLYFSSATKEKSKINAEVDDLFDSISAQLDSGIDPTQILENIKEDETSEKERLSLAALQKHLESLITLETGLREKLVPAITSMQFEDNVRQRLTRLNSIWAMGMAHINSGKQSDEAKVTDSILNLMNSNIEREFFYKHVLLKEPPPFSDDSETWFDSLI